MKDNVSIIGSAHTNVKHDSAVKHVTGRADYTDDIAQPEGTLHAYLGVSDVAHAKLLGIDVTEVLAELETVEETLFDPEPQDRQMLQDSPLEFTVATTLREAAAKAVAALPGA